MQQVLGLQQMSELATSEYVVTKIIKANDNATWYKIGDRKILMTCKASLVAGIDLEALTVFGRRHLALDRRKRSEATQRTAKRVSAHVIERPHVLGVEAQMGLRDHGLAVGPDKTEILDRVGDVPAVIAVLPFTATAEAAHCRRRAALVFRGERHLVGPTATFGAVSVDLAVDLVADEVLADQARDHAAPAAMRV